MAEWKKVLVSGSSIEIRDITGSLGLRPSQSVVISASAALSAPIAVSQVATQSGTYKTGDRYALLTSQSAYFYNHNAGYPSSNAWGTNLQGSYFNNFDANTDVSEILRFIAGLLSQSAPDAAPNTKTFGGLNPRFVNPSALTINGRIPSQSTNSDILYLQSKGFANSGSASFAGFGNVYNAATFQIDYSSSASGNGSNISSSNDPQLFGLGGNTLVVNVSASTVFNFYSSSNETITTNTSSSVSLITLSSENASLGGAIRRTISTANPAVIPAAYQDGRFTGSFASAYNPVIFATATSGSTGWYHYTQSIVIYTGSQTANQGISYTTSSRVFRSAYADSTFLPNTITHTHSTSSLTAISRSLSGAPYLSQSTYLYICTSSGIFNPLYSVENNNVFQVTTGSTSFLSKSLGEIILNMNAIGTIATSNLVYSSSENTVAKNTSTYPSQNDVIKVSASFALNPTAGATSITQAGFIVTNTGSLISASAYSRNGANYTGSGIFLNYFTPGTFDQPIASGTMAVYNRPQGYDGGTLTAFTENFTGETFRLQITDTALSGSYTSGSKFTTSSYLAYNLTGLDLQVKPGYLIKPGGSYKYWLTDPNSSQVYKYYIRAFRRDLTSAATSMTVNVGTVLSPWESTTSPTASIALLFRSSGKENQAIPRIYDITQLTSNVISSSMATDNFKNPFSSNIALYGNTGGGLSTTTYTVPLRSADGMTLDTTNRDFIVIVRYTGDPTPISSISITIS